MNKQLINKYKPEFYHWLNEGKLLMSNKNAKVWITLTVNTWTCTTPSVDHLLIVINDDYVEFRKALAEGKTIEYLGQSSNLWHEVPEPIFILHPTCYRIKPDEPKFKVGDFVTPLNRDINCSVWQIDKVLSCNTLASGIILLDPRTVQLWTPIKGEWCWFYDKASNKYSHLAKFNGMWKNKFRSNTDTPWNFCEPFLNSLPSYLKDK